MSELHLSALPYMKEIDQGLETKENVPVIFAQINEMVRTGQRKPTFSSLGTQGLNVSYAIECK